MASRRRNPIEPKWLLVFIFFIAGAFTGGLCIYLYSNANSTAIVKHHFPSGTYEYTNPTLLSDFTPPAINTANKDLQLKLQGLIDHSNAAGITQVGLYYRDLEPGTWIDINGVTQFSPGVLLKIPIMITYYQLAQTNAAILDEQVTFRGPYQKTDELFREQPALEIGKTYSVNDLLSEMMVQNDNDAANLLFENVDKNILNQTFSDLGIDFNESNIHSDFISIRLYSNFFRVLYNATYLSAAYSEKMLALLAQNNSHTFLQSHLPQSVPLISKVGGRTIQEGVQIYECDIVYYPNHDYLLCITGKAKTQNELHNLFAQIGQVVYEDTAYRYSN